MPLERQRLPLSDPPQSVSCRLVKGSSIPLRGAWVPGGQWRTFSWPRLNYIPVSRPVQYWPFARLFGSLRYGGVLSAGGNSSRASRLPYRLGPGLILAFWLRTDVFTSETLRTKGRLKRGRTTFGASQTLKACVFAPNTLFSGTISATMEKRRQCPG